MKQKHPDNRSLEVARLVKTACIQTALEGYQSASISGLCEEGAWEAAVSAMKMLDLEKLLREV